MSKTNKPNPVIFWDITASGEKLGRITIELYADVVPKTAENMRVLTTGERGPKLHLKGRTFHRVIPGFCLQGGCDRGDGTGGCSIYGKNFNDESFAGKAGRNIYGTLSMANAGRNTNGSQFFVNVGSNDSLNNKHVVFGKVIDGMDVCKKIERLGASSGKTSKRIVIANCGEIIKEKPEAAASSATSTAASAAAPAAAPAAAAAKGATTPAPVPAQKLQSKAVSQAKALVDKKNKQAAAAGATGGGNPEVKTKLMIERAEQLEAHAKQLTERAAVLRERATAGQRREREE